MARSALINVIVQAATKAGRALLRDFNEVEKLQVSMKGPANFVSAADRRAEEIIERELSRARPGYSFLMEESGTREGSDRTHRWIVDPLDGTTNFLHGIPLFCTSIALERDGQIVAGVIYNPAMNELYTAEKGGGAFLNDSRIRIAARRDLGQAVVALGIPHRGRGDILRFFRETGAVIPRAAGLRRTGAAALDLAWVAAGRFDGFWEHDLQPWDMAAGILLLREAGATVTDAKGGDLMLETGSVVTGNEAIHGALMSALIEAATPRSQRA